MPNYLDKLDPRASEILRSSVGYMLLHDYMTDSGSKLFVAIVNLAFREGISIGIDLCRDALKSGDPDYGKPSN
jgi:hypothetical protein